MKGCDAMPLPLGAEAIVGAGWFLKKQRQFISRDILSCR
jgi:hypothetical protein